VRALAEEKLKRLDEALIETRNLRRQLGRIVRDWDRRLAGRPNGQRANLLHSLETLPIATETRANSRRRGWPRK